MCTKRNIVRLVDILLIAATIVVVTLIIVKNPFKKISSSGRSAVTITVSSQCENLFGKDIISALVQEFEDQNPGLRIKMTGQNMPVITDDTDIVFFDDGALAWLVNNAALASLDPYTETQTGQWAASWALPIVSFMDLFFYNIDILEAANCDRPPKTRAEFLDAARAVAKNNPSASPQVSAFALGLSQADPLALRREVYPWVWADGGEIGAPGDGEGAVTLSGTAKNALSFLGQLGREGLLAPRSFERTGAQRLEEFAGGKIAMMMGPAQNITFLRQNAPDLNFGVTTVPVTAHGKNRLGLSGIYAGINSICARPGEAWVFLAFIAGKTQTFAEALGAVPGSFPSAFPGEYIEKNPLYAKAWDIFEAADIVEYHPDPVLEAEMSRLIREQLAETPAH